MSWRFGHPARVNLGNTLIPLTPVLVGLDPRMHPRTASVRMSTWPDCFTVSPAAGPVLTPSGLMTNRWPANWRA